MYKSIYIINGPLPVKCQLGLLVLINSFQSRLILYIITLANSKLFYSPNGYLWTGISNDQLNYFLSVQVCLPSLYFGQYQTVLLTRETLDKKECFFWQINPFVHTVVKQQITKIELMKEKKNKREQEQNNKKMQENVKTIN